MILALMVCGITSMLWGLTGKEETEIRKSCMGVAAICFCLAAVVWVLELEKFGG